MRFWSTGELRAAFAQLMAATYGREVPAYHTLVDVAAAVNADVLGQLGATAERLGSIGRVSAERHGAIRVGTPAELREVARVFGALGMHPVGFYDLRDARSAVPVISTAFRPIDSGELARNPFRMFTSMLVTHDRRFFSAHLQGRLDAFLARRTLFPAELITLSDKAILADGLVDDNAERFLKLATAAFALSAEPVDRAWYAELEAVSAVAADIGGVTSTHINHLTPRVLDIDELYRRMSAHGVTMIDSIQGPPRWDGPDVLLRQTSFRALAEQRLFLGADGSVAPGSLRVRFGEVEARGIALTPAGRDRYDVMMAEIDRVAAGSPSAIRADVAATVWARNLPASELGLLRDGLGFFSYSVADSSAFVRGADAVALVQAGALTATPIVYEDFLPRSAAGIFQSNLSTETTWDAARRGTRRDAGWLSDVLGEQVRDPADLYAAQQRRSLDSALARLR
ncbi:MAG: DUF1338 domain-containing protein [Pseudonocardiales bacterium]|nr:MAG: DUF1338 domain-containing protein [Pseudonocardiales bacterium]